MVYALLTCCCDKGDDLDEDFPYNRLIISFDYVEAHTEEQNNNVFRNRPWAEWQSNNNLRNVRRETMAARIPSNENAGGGVIGSLRKDFGKNMRLNLSKSMKLE